MGKYFVRMCDQNSSAGKVNKISPLQLKRGASLPLSNRLIGISGDGEMEIKRLEQDRENAWNEVDVTNHTINNLFDAMSALTKRISRFPDIKARKSIRGGEKKQSMPLCDDKLSRSKSALKPGLSLHEESSILEAVEQSCPEFASLSNACCRLQENLIQTSIESDHALQNLSEQSVVVKSYSKRLKRLEKAICKLHDENTILKDKLKKSRKEKNGFVKAVKEYVGTQQNRKRCDEEFQATVASLRVHERVLANCNSFDSTEPTSSQNDDDASLSSHASNSTSSSLVTDEGIATVNICNNERNNEIPEGKRELFDSFEIGGSSVETYTLSFPCSSKIGLQFQKIRIAAISTDELQQEPLDSEKTLCDALTVMGTCRENSEHDEGSEEFSHNENPSHAYVVSGAAGFISGTNYRPKIGTRLIAINDSSVIRGHWKFEQVVQAIKSAPGPISLTFRSEPLNKRQKEALNRAIASSLTHQKGSDSPKKFQDTVKKFFGSAKDDHEHFPSEQIDPPKKKEASQPNAMKKMFQLSKDKRNNGKQILESSKELVKEETTSENTKKSVFRTFF